MSLITELETWLPRVEAAAQALGLDPGPVDFRLVPAPVLYEAVAYHGLGGYGHWTRGRDYWRTKEQLDRGRGRIYEVVFNGNPIIAYLLEGNTLAAQILVMAHVMGHAAIMRHHVLEDQSGVALAARMNAARQRFMAYTEQVGPQAVEATLDAALSIQDQVAEHQPTGEPPAATPPDPDGVLWASSEHRQSLRRRRNRQTLRGLPTADLLGWIAREAPGLDEWQRDICQVVREEGLSFRPLRGIKTIHESFAVWTHRAILRALDLPSDLAVEAERVHAQVVAPHPLQWNPYALYPLLEAMAEDYGLTAAIGIWMQESDASLIRNYLTLPYWERLQLYGWQWEEGWEADRAVHGRQDWKRMRDGLADALARTPPQVIVQRVDADNTLWLHHPDEGYALDPGWAQKTLAAIKQLWGGDVSLVDHGTHWLDDTKKEEHA